jgi:LPS sulfotransferase NodH
MGGLGPDPRIFADLLTIVHRPHHRSTRSLSAQRCSSKRLARLMLAAGLGVPMEYLNENSISALTARWGVSRREFVSQLYMIRSANGVFASNLQQQQVHVWPYRQDIDDLFQGAIVVSLVREDRRAQAASLAASMLTGEWGFDEPQGSVEFGSRQLRRAAAEATSVLALEDDRAARCFEHYGVSPIRVTSEQVNRADLSLIEGFAARLDVECDRVSAERMLECDAGPYRGYEALKARLLEYVQ